MKKLILFTILTFCATLSVAQNLHRLNLPNQEQLSSGNVLFLMQDSEGALWYATEGGGLCRDDGLQVDIFRSDAENPDRLGSNNIACLAEYGHYIIIGTFHGAYALNRKDFSIQRINEVDDKRIDDILVTKDNRLFVTANKKILVFNDALQLTASHPSRFHDNEVYVNHLYEDARGTVWATQWNGGLIRLDAKSNSFTTAAWSGAAPADLADDFSTGQLWVGTIGNGIVRYHPENGTIEPQPETGNTICVDLLLSKDGKKIWMTTTNDLLLFELGPQLTAIYTENILPQGQKVLNRLSLDLQGTLLVAGSEPGPFAISTSLPQNWYDGTLLDGDKCWELRQRHGLILKDLTTQEEHPVHSPLLHTSPVITKRKNEAGLWIADGLQLLACTADTIMAVATLPVHPVTFTDDGRGHLWLSTGKEIHRFSLLSLQEDSVINDVKDVGAITASADGTLWMGTIFGKLLCYKDGQLTEDVYASNECGDGITALDTDSCGRIIIVSDRYTRLYDTTRHTLRQQTRSPKDTYLIELQETRPEERWIQPNRERLVERIPHWMNSWWMWCIYIFILTVIIALFIYNYILRKQRREFLEMMKSGLTPQPLETPNAEEEKKNEPETSNTPAEERPKAENAWLQKAIAQVEENLSNEQYTVEDLSRDLCMSRMTFYRKIQSLTGQKPTEFIRTIRLRRAATLLQQGEMSVTEISYATGFSSVSYFSRCFRTMFGVPPTLFGKDTTLG